MHYLTTFDFREKRFETAVAGLPLAMLTVLLALGPADASAQAKAASQQPVPGRVAEPSLSYTIKPSDKLIRLSRDMLANQQAWNEVAKYNGLKNPDVIFPGQKLEIPLRHLKFQPVNGKIISAEGDVTLGGQPMQPGQPIGDGSQIRTGSNSSAVVELGDGSRIKLLPGSLAEVVTSRSYAMRDASASGSTNWFSGLMRLTSGALEALASKNVQRATPLQIETPTSLVGVRGTEFRVAFEDPASGSARTEVIEGLVRADNPTQKSGADLPLGTGAVIKPAEKDVNVVKLLPAPDLASISADVVRPLGAWPMPVLAGAAGYRVQVASDEGFEKIVRDLKVSSGNVELASLANGNWYARVRGIDPNGLEGFNTVKLIAVKDAPPSQWRVSYSSLGIVDGKTVLSWVGLRPDGQPMEASGYSVVLAKDAALTQTVSTAEGSGPRLELGELKAGVYFLRLRSKPVAGAAGAAAAAAESETYRFELTENWGQSVFDQTSALQAVK